MNISKIAHEFERFVKDEAIVAVGTSEYDKEFIDEFIKLLLINKKKVYFIATTSKQAIQFKDLGQTVISLSNKEIDIAIEFGKQADNFNNFIKSNTKSFIRDKMIAQSALNLIVVINNYDFVEKIDKDVYVEISSFAWERTILNLQGYGLARVVKDIEDNFIKTETGHYLARITIDSNISLDEFEYSVRNIPGVLETGVFLGLCDTFFIVNNKDEITIKIRKN